MQAWHGCKKVVNFLGLVRKPAPLTQGWFYTEKPLNLGSAELIFPVPVASQVEQTYNTLIL